MKGKFCFVLFIWGGTQVYICKKEGRGRRRKEKRKEGMMTKEPFAPQAKIFWAFSVPEGSASVPVSQPKAA